MFVQCIEVLHIQKCLTFVILIGFCTVSMFICLCIVFCFMWTPERLATTAVEANGDLNK